MPETGLGSNCGCDQRGAKLTQLPGRCMHPSAARLLIGLRALTSLSEKGYIDNKLSVRDCGRVLNPRRTEQKSVVWGIPLHVTCRLAEEELAWHRTFIHLQCHPICCSGDDADLAAVMRCVAYKTSRCWAGLGSRWLGMWHPRRGQRRFW